MRRGEIEQDIINKKKEEISNKEQNEDKENSKQIIPHVDWNEFLNPEDLIENDEQSDEEDQLYQQMNKQNTQKRKRKSNNSNVHPKKLSNVGNDNLTQERNYMNQKENIFKSPKQFSTPWKNPIQGVIPQPIKSVSTTIPSQHSFKASSSIYEKKSLPSQQISPSNVESTAVQSNTHNIINKTLNLQSSHSSSTQNIKNTKNKEKAITPQNEWAQFLNSDDEDDDDDDDDDENFNGHY